MARSARKRKSQHEPGRKKALMRNQINSLFIHKRIRTTLGQAKKMRPNAEPIITGLG